MRQPFTTPNGVTIHYFGALGLRSISPYHYFGKAKYIFVGSHNYKDVKETDIPDGWITPFFCNETPLDKRALFNAVAYAFELIRGGEKNIVFICDAGQNRSKIAAQLTANALGCEDMGVCHYDSLIQADVDFIATQKDERFPNAMQNIADYFNKTN